MPTSSEPEKNTSSVQAPIIERPPALGRPLQLLQADLMVYEERLAWWTLRRIEKGADDYLSYKLKMYTRWVKETREEIAVRSPVQATTHERPVEAAPEATE